MKSSRRHLSAPLLLEIGCEEIPARFLEQAQKTLGECLQAALQKAQLLPSSPPPLQTYSTPRRLVAFIPEVLREQPDKVEEILGPPVKVAVDAQGEYTRAAESFAVKNQARAGDLVKVTTPKGEYMAIRKHTPGRPALELLPEILPAVITGLSFPKSMYWVAKSGPRFIRPIRWLLALLGEGEKARVMPFEIAGVRSGNCTYAHRARGKARIRIRSFKEYCRELRELHVELDPLTRRERVRNECKVILEELNLAAIEDKELEDWIVNSTEWPTAVLASFDQRFLRLPREILVTVMRDHQKYFAVEDRNGNLQPRFIAVLNSGGDTKGLIRAGHERVLEARFADAEFFWNADLRMPFENRADLLAKVTYQTELGSYADKVRRMKVNASHLSAALEAARKFRPVDADHSLRAVELSKCDLTTRMVQEFPELQGVVGGLYARAWGESKEVHEAIYDHYLPLGVDDPCPRSPIGAVVSLADKIDGVVGGFAVGNAPTGSSDPFGLRRQANGIIKVLIEVSLPIALESFVMAATRQFICQSEERQIEVIKAVLEFLRERLRYYLESVRMLRYDTVRAVLAAGWDAPLDALRRAEALEKIRGSQDMEALCVAAKRIKNILSKSASASDWQPGGVEVMVLKEDAEKDLHFAYGEVVVQMESLVEAGNYEKALGLIARLRPSVDHFFDKVLVMAEDKILRANRLRLLGNLDKVFSRIADLAQIVVGPENVDASTSKGVTRGR